MSDRINDKEQFVRALLVITGFTLEEMETNEERFNSVIEQLKSSRVLEIPYKEARIEYLQKTLNETEVQILADSIKDDIHKFSQTPDFSDDKFSGNTSGVAMRFKVESLDNLAKVKERFFIACIKRRMKIINEYLHLMSKATFDVENVIVTFNRALLVNQLELAQALSYYREFVSRETILTQVPFVENVEAEIEKMQKEQVEIDKRVETLNFEEN